MNLDDTGLEVTPMSTNEIESNYANSPLADKPYEDTTSLDELIRNSMAHKRKQAILAAIAKQNRTRKHNRSRNKLQSKSRTKNRK